MAQSKQEGSDINISMCKIKKQVPGNHLVTTGSACVVRWPWEIEFGSSKAQGKDATFVVTTSQVFSQCDSKSKAAWRADFQPLPLPLPLNWWRSSEKFSLNDVTVYEVPIPTSIQNHAITLTFIPTETLHSQKKLSKVRTDELKKTRSQPCHQPCRNEAEFQAHDRKQLLCYVLVETTLEDDKISLHCYLLCRNESGSYFLQYHGNKSEIRTLKDFDSSEKPRGSVILNESGHVVGLLAFGDEDEIVPVFFERNMQGDDPSSHVESDTENSNKAPRQESSGSDGHEMQSDKQVDNNGLMKLKREIVGASSRSSRHSTTISDNPETALQSHIRDTDPESQINQQMPGNRNQPQEFSFHSFEPQTREGNGVCEEKSNGDTIPRQQRSQGEQLISDALVENVILHKVYVMDTISRYLDMSCKGIQNWRHLASLNGVPENLQLRCQEGEHHSRSEKMFDLLAAEKPDLRIGDLKQHLRDLKINNVEHYIQKLKLGDDEKVADILESSDLDSAGRILIMLDLLPDETWKSLGNELGVNRETLKHIKTDCANQQENPAGHVINIIYRKQPTMPIKKFEEKLKDIGRFDVAKKLDKISGKGTIHDLYKDLDLMRDVTSMLNEADNSLIKNYKDLADICKIAIEEYESLQPPCAESPTKLVLDDIVRRKPTFTVEELFTNFRDMKRVDVIQAICSHFRVPEEDMLTIKRKLNILDE